MSDGVVPRSKYERMDLWLRRSRMATRCWSPQTRTRLLSWHCLSLSEPVPTYQALMFFEISTESRQRACPTPPSFMRSNNLDMTAGASLTDHRPFVADPLHN